MLLRYLKKLHQELIACYPNGNFLSLKPYLKLNNDLIGQLTDKTQIGAGRRRSTAASSTPTLPDVVDIGDLSAITATPGVSADFVQRVKDMIALITGELPASAQEVISQLRMTKKIIQWLSEQYESDELVKLTNQMNALDAAMTGLQHKFLGEEFTRDDHAHYYGQQIISHVYDPAKDEDENHAAADQFIGACINPPPVTAAAPATATATATATPVATTPVTAVGVSGVGVVGTAASATAPVTSSASSVAATTGSASPVTGPMVPITGSTAPAASASAAAPAASASTGFTGVVPPPIDMSLVGSVSVAADPGSPRASPDGDTLEVDTGFDVLGAPIPQTRSNAQRLKAIQDAARMAARLVEKKKREDAAAAVKAQAEFEARVEQATSEILRIIDNPAHDWMQIWDNEEAAAGTVGLTQMIYNIVNEKYTSQRDLVHEVTKRVRQEMTPTRIHRLINQVIPIQAKRLTGTTTADMIENFIASPPYTVRTKGELATVYKSSWTDATESARRIYDIIKQIPSQHYATPIEDMRRIIAAYRIPEEERTLNPELVAYLEDPNKPLSTELFVVYRTYLEEKLRRMEQQRIDELLLRGSTTTPSIPARGSYSDMYRALPPAPATPSYTAALLPPSAAVPTSGPTPRRRTSRYAAKPPSRREVYMRPRRPQATESLLPPGTFGDSETFTYSPTEGLTPFPHLKSGDGRSRRRR